MGTQGPACFPGASLMYISPGNIINYHNLKKSIPKTSTDEVQCMRIICLTHPFATLHLSTSLETINILSPIPQSPVPPLNVDESEKTLQ